MVQLEKYQVIRGGIAKHRVISDIDHNWYPADHQN
jgi:hypothetical protein